MFAIPTQANSGPLEPPPAGPLLRFCALLLLRSRLTCFKARRRGATHGEASGVTYFLALLKTLGSPSVPMASPFQLGHVRDRQTVREEVQRKGTLVATVVARGDHLRQAVVRMVAEGSPCHRHRRLAGGSSS